MRHALQRRLANIPCSRNYDHQRVADRPKQVGPSALLIMAGRLIGEGCVEHGRVDYQECADAQEERFLYLARTQEAANQETHSDQGKEKNARVQSPDLHGLTGSLPA